MSEIIGLLFAVIMGTLLMTGLAKHQSNNHELTKAITTAQQHKKINEAATAYIQQHFQYLQSVTGATTPTIITIPMLQAANVNLPAGFSPTNPFGQTWQVQILQPTAGHLQALSVATGGETLNDVQASQVAKLTGYGGGFIPKNDSGIYNSNQAYGAFASWNIPLSGYLNLAGGRPVSLLNFNQGQLAGNYLYRNAVPGQPQLNRMNTALDMGGNDINQANTLNANTVSASGDIHATNANIRGSVTTNTLRANARLSTGEFVQIDGIATENSPCAPNGLIGRDTVGALLSCQSGIWKKNSQDAAVATANCEALSCDIYLPASGTWQILGIAYGHMAIWGGAQFYINGALVDSNNHYGDQEGTGYAPMTGTYIYSGQAGKVTATARFGHGHWGDNKISLIAVKSSN